MVIGPLFSLIRLIHTGVKNIFQKDLGNWLRQFFIWTFCVYPKILFNINELQNGMRTQLQLGKYLRKRYYKLLDGGKYSSEKVYVRSSDYDRTILSANANLLGFFPTEIDEVWTDELKWRPIPIHTIPIKEDHIVALERPCSRYDIAMSDIYYSPEFLAYQKQADRYFQLIKKNSGYKNATHYEVFLVWDALRAQYLENMT